MDLNEPFVDEDDVDGLDLTPRQAPPVRGRHNPGKRVLMAGVLTAILVVLGVVAWQGLSNAALYFRNADEAVAQREDLGDRRFRLQGTVVDGSVRPDGTSVRFAVTHNDVEVDVVHEGDPPELFQPDIPVVLEGRWSQTQDHFESDRMLVKHSEEYESENPDRTDDYVGEGGADEARAE